MKNQLQKMAPAWHAEAIELLQNNFTAIHSAFLDSTKKAAWMGLFLNYIKLRGKEDGSIPHGEFGPWLKKNFPDAPWRTCCTYMSLARDLSEKGKFQIRQFSEFANCGDLPKQILNLVEGKTQQQLFLEFKQVEEDGDEMRVKRGRLKGAGGRPPEPTDSIEAIVKFNRESALRRMGRVDKELGSLGINFLSLPDDVLTAWSGSLERTARCVREWLKTPPARRDMKEIQKLYRNS